MGISVPNLQYRQFLLCGLVDFLLCVRCWIASTAGAQIQIFQMYIKCRYCFFVLICVGCDWAFYLWWMFWPWWSNVINLLVLYFSSGKREEMEMALLQLGKIMTDLQLLEYWCVLGSPYIAHLMILWCYDWNLFPCKERIPESSVNVVFVAGHHLYSLNKMFLWMLAIT